MRTVKHETGAEVIERFLRHRGQLKHQGTEQGE
jgi:hypothetical protein